MRVEEERMKESGKLIELLNEYIEEKELGNTVKEIDDDYFVNNYNNGDGYLCEEVISKKFGFIKWLVKHFMLNMTKIDARIALSDFNATDRMLMALAISDNPIELLIDCLE